MLTTQTEEEANFCLTNCFMGSDVDSVLMPKKLSMQQRTMLRS